MLKRHEKIAVIMGGARGTGAAIAQLFADEGALVIIADIDEDGGKATAEAIGGVYDWQRDSFGRRTIGRFSGVTGQLNTGCDGQR